MTNVRLSASLQVSHSDDILGDATGMPVAVVQEDFEFLNLAEALSFRGKLVDWLLTMPQPGEPTAPPEPSEEKLLSIFQKAEEVEGRGLRQPHPVSFDPRDRFKL